MIRIPAIDLRNHRVVRLKQGDYAQQTTFADEPQAWVDNFSRDGAKHLHLVDLDAAKDGASTQRELIRDLIYRFHGGVQVGGGVRNESDIELLLAIGASRVVIGSMAVKDPERVSRWGERYGFDRIVIALDAKRDEDGIWRLPVHGWTEDSGFRLSERFADLLGAGFRDFLCTDIDRDGMMTGPNVQLYRTLGKVESRARVIASGGIGSLDDVRALKDSGAAACVIGRALLEGKFSLKDAIEC